MHSATSRPMQTAREPRNTPSVVVVYPCRTDVCNHEIATQDVLAKRIADIRGDAYGGIFNPAAQYDRPLYFVPNDTLVRAELPDALQIGSEEDLFGGVVPHAFVATKTITHALPSSASRSPQGWSDDFCQRVHDVVLPGYSAFSRRDALTAGKQLLERGPVRMKKPSGIGGMGQTVVPDLRQLEEELERLDTKELERIGLVLERNLVGPETRSVGQVRVGNFLATYCGTQRLTPDNRGAEVYGGSDLIVVRGDFDELLQLPLGQHVHIAIAQARTYHAAAIACYPGMFASRCNYDIAQGVDEEGRWYSGVLEQSWRIGGASGAEVAALEAFRDDPSLSVVRASTTEIYGDNPSLPPGAAVYFQGNDDRVGPLTKYARLEDYGNT
ncbi:DUF3182 family protein [Noviherbaspirillum sp. ST9]|uniref:DUF3182 family protein n=1 Tax=Noviherbaspirillum sp. ST9 TaxID=3401606 RepID=UPI003B58A162